MIDMDYILESVIDVEKQQGTLIKNILCVFYFNLGYFSRCLCVYLHLTFCRMGKGYVPLYSFPLEGADILGAPIL